MKILSDNELPELKAHVLKNLVLQVSIFGEGGEYSKVSKEINFQ